MISQKRAEHFEMTLIVVSLLILISVLAFLTEDIKLTGFATANLEQPSLREFDNINYLGSLVAGTYYIDNNGIVYWTDDDSKPAIGKVKFLDEIQKNRQIYIDKEGNIGYLIE